MTSGDAEREVQVIRLAVRSIREAGTASLARIPGQVLRESVARAIRENMLDADVTAGFQNSLPDPVSAADPPLPGQSPDAGRRLPDDGTEHCEAETLDDIAES